MSDEDAYRDLIADVRRALDKCQMRIINIDRTMLDADGLKENDEAIAFFAEMRATLDALEIPTSEAVTREDAMGLLSVLENYLDRM